MNSSQTPDSGIFELMRDLGQGLEQGGGYLLGGGNPAYMRETYDFFNGPMREITEKPHLFSKAIQHYTEPKGYLPFRVTLAEYFNHKFGWKIDHDHICLTNGMQNGFYMLLNYFAGNSLSGSIPQIYCAKVPDYIGYFDTVSTQHFSGSEAKKIPVDDLFFRYEIDFESIEMRLKKEQIDPDDQKKIASFVISSPNNPSSHVLAPDEQSRLIKLATSYRKYLIFDHAYGSPFPNLIYRSSEMPPFAENLIHCFSFSKIGLPGIRLGFIIADHKIIEQLSLASGVQNLSPSSFNAVFLDQVFKTRSLDQYLEHQIKHFYRARKDLALDILVPYLRDCPAMLHESQGGFFLWLYLKELKKSGREIYRELKDQGVIVVPGEYFYIDPPEEAFLRISYTAKEQDLVAGLKILGKHLKKLYQKN